MPAKPISIPKGFRRLNNFSLDSTGAYSSLEALNEYCISPTAYPGQICTVYEGDDFGVYLLDSGKTPVRINLGNENINPLPKIEPTGKWVLGVEEQSVKWIATEEC